MNYGSIILIKTTLFILFLIFFLELTLLSLVRLTKSLKTLSNRLTFIISYCYQFNLNFNSNQTSNHNFFRSTRYNLTLKCTAATTTTGLGQSGDNPM